LRLGFHRGKPSLVRVKEAPQWGGNPIRFGLPSWKHPVIVVKTLVLPHQSVFNGAQGRTVGLSV
jgi:hypothetical protein